MDVCTPVPHNAGWPIGHLGTSKVFFRLLTYLSNPTYMFGILFT